jgi:tetratricopeptide (TPR) repeat protein
MNDEIINKYLSDELNIEEKALFEKRIMKEPDLKEEIEANKYILKNIKHIENYELKQRLVQLEKSKFKNGKQYSKISIAVAILSLFGLILFWFFKDKTNKNNNLQEQTTKIQDTKNTQNKVNVDSLNISKKVPINTLPNTKVPVIIPKVKVSKPKEIKKVIEEKDKVYAFEPYIDDEIKSVVRGEEEQTDYEIFISYYVQKDYKKALSSFENIDETLRKSDNLMFLKANVLLGLNKRNEAKMILEGIIKNDKSRYVEMAKQILVQLK